MESLPTTREKWKQLTNQTFIDYNKDPEECLLMGFSETSDDVDVLTQHYIYIQRLFKNNELDL